MRILGFAQYGPQLKRAHKNADGRTNPAIASLIFADKK
jgi:hypothetical protein